METDYRIDGLTVQPPTEEKKIELFRQNVQQLADIATIAVVGNISPEQIQRYRIKYDLAKAYLLGEDETLDTSTLLIEAESAGITIDELSLSIVAKGDLYIRLLNRTEAERKKVINMFKGMSDLDRREFDIKAHYDALVLALKSEFMPD